MSIDKDSIYELQKIDSNCNDCIFMQRDMDKHKKSQEFQHKMQLDYFNTLKNKLIKSAKDWKDRKYDLETWDKLLTEAEKMKFQFNKNASLINFGNCQKLNKPVSFIPNICQLETQQCFIHRRDATENN